MSSIYAPPNLAYLTPAFLTLHILGGHVGLPFIILTALCSKTVSRHPTLINFCISWVIYSVSYCLLIYSGHRHDPNPPSRICVAQAALVHGAPSMAAVACLLVVMQIWSTFRDPQQSSVGLSRWPRSGQLALVLALPYVAFFAFVAASIIIAQRHPESVTAANGLYCTITLDPFRRFGVPSFCTVMLVLVLGFEAAIIIQCYRSWQLISRVFPLADRKTSRSTCVRVGLFNLFSALSLSASVFFLADTLDPWPYMVQASIPLAAVFIFGTQRDLFLVWCFWKRKHKESATLSGGSMPSGHLARTSESDNMHSDLIVVQPMSSSEWIS